MIRINKKASLSFACLLCSVIALAQEYHYKAALDSVKATGFYQLEISPEISSHIKIDFSDIRIADDKGKWIPHIVNTPLPSLLQPLFKEFPIIYNTIIDSGRSELIIENKGSTILVNYIKLKSINEMLLFIKNASVSRYASLSGSNDKIHWFIIAENILLAKNYETTENYFINSIKFDFSDYHYFKLVINNANAAPLNIMKAGSYSDLAYQKITYSIPNPNPFIHQTDSSNGRSYILVKNNTAFHIDRINVLASGAKFFERSADLFLAENDSTGKGINFNSLASFKISSKGTNEFDIKKINAKSFYIVIENKDNPPLKINSISTKQHINNIVTYLEKDKRYYLLTNNETASEPDYDLAIFKDSIPKNINAIGIGPFIKVRNSHLALLKNTKNIWWLWPSIICAIFMLAFLSWKLLRDLKKNES